MTSGIRMEKSKAVNEGHTRARLFVVVTAFAAELSLIKPQFFAYSFLLFSNDHQSRKAMVYFASVPETGEDET